MDPVRIPLRWRDFDALGHVTASVYITLLAEARDIWLDQVLGRSFDPADYVLAHIEIDYRREIERGTPSVAITHACAGLGSKSITLEGRLLSSSDGDEYAYSRVVIVLWDREKRASRALTEHEREALIAARG
jgi:acyl-CoA thioesterase FadM